MPHREYHIVVLGTGGVGKSCLTSQFVHNVWIESYDPTIEDSYRKQIQVDGRQVILEILDTAGTEQFTAMRELYMKSGKGFILVFSITSLSSIRELIDLHDQLLNIKNDKHIPLVLVGNKADLADYRTVSSERALAVSKRWGNAPYYETSAKVRLNIDEVFIDLVRQIIRKDADSMEEHMRNTRSHDGRRRNTNRDMDGVSDSEWRWKTRKKRKKKKNGEFGCVIL